MDATAALFSIAFVWGAIGVIVATVMRRRGFHAWSWLIVGVAFGPLSIPLAVSAGRRETPTLFRTVADGLPGSGDVDVLVGVDGSDGCRAALRSSLELFGPRIGRLTLAAVVDRDTAETPGLWEEEARASACLDELADSVSTPPPRSVLLEGAPAVALMRYAASEGYEVVAVGHRGRGASKALLGSVASQLAKDTEVPVLIV